MSNKIPTLTLTLTNSPVQVKSKKLKGKWTIETADQLKSIYSFDGYSIRIEKGLVSNKQSKCGTCNGPFPYYGFPKLNHEKYTVTRTAIMFGEIQIICCSEECKTMFELQDA